MDSGAWRATAYGVTKSWTELSIHTNMRTMVSKRKRYQICGDQRQRVELDEGGQKVKHDKYS